MPVPRFRNCRQLACARRSRFEEAGLKRNRSFFRHRPQARSGNRGSPLSPLVGFEPGRSPILPRLALLRKSKLSRERSPSRSAGPRQAPIRLSARTGRSRKQALDPSHPLRSLTSGANPVCPNRRTLRGRASPSFPNPFAASQLERTPFARTAGPYDEERTLPLQPVGSHPIEANSDLPAARSPRRGEPVLIDPLQPSRPKQASALPPPDPRSKGKPSNRDPFAKRWIEANLDPSAPPDRS